MSKLIIGNKSFKISGDKIFDRPVAKNKERTQNDWFPKKKELELSKYSSDLYEDYAQSLIPGDKIIYSYGGVEFHGKITKCVKKDGEIFKYFVLTHDNKTCMVYIDSYESRKSLLPYLIF